MTPQELREQYKKETGKTWSINPVCHGELGAVSWEYQVWLESRLAERERELAKVKWERDRLQGSMDMLADCGTTLHERSK